MTTSSSIRPGDRVCLSELGRRTFRWACIGLSEFGTVKAVRIRKAMPWMCLPKGTPDGFDVQVERDERPKMRNREGKWYDSSFWERA